MNLTVEELSIRPVAPEHAEHLGELFGGLAASPEAKQSHPHSLAAQEARNIAQGSEPRHELCFAASLATVWADTRCFEAGTKGTALRVLGSRSGCPTDVPVSAGACSRMRSNARTWASTMMLKLHLDNPCARHIAASEGFDFHAIAEDPTQSRNCRRSS